MFPKYIINNGHEIELDILYSKTLEASQTKDCPSPILLRFHGGGLVTGSSLYPAFFSLWMLQLIERHSAITVSPNYRLIPEATVQDVLDDVEDAWKWIHEDLASCIFLETGIHVDVNRIMTRGDSVGGYLSLQVALSHLDKIRAVTAAYPLIEGDSLFLTGENEKTVFGLPMLKKDIITEHMLQKKLDRRRKSSQQILLKKFCPRDRRNYHPLLRLDDGDTFPRGGVAIWQGTEDSAVPREGLLKLEAKLKESDLELKFEIVWQPAWI
ncbi:Alpha/Beta hydrolase protein [Trichoderma evansii]